MRKRRLQSWNSNGKNQREFNSKNQSPALSQGNSLVQVSRYLTAFHTPTPLNFFHTSNQTLLQLYKPDCHFLSYMISSLKNRAKES